MKDLRVKQILADERIRQKSVINLIASENYVSADVLEALGSGLTNKYAEGYPNARYYGGNKNSDKIEILCQDRALKLFGLLDKKGKSGLQSKWRVNVQPLSGSPANVAVYTALIPQGGKVMGMSLSHGGHLTHGHKVSVTGKFWQQVPFGVDPKTEMIDYAEVRKIAVAEKPQIIVAGFTAYPRVVDWREFRSIADEVGAILMVDMSHVAGLVAGREYPSPFDYADVVTTTVHKTLRGPRSAMIFSRADKFLIKEVSKKIDGVVKKVQEKFDFPSLIDKAVFPGMQGGPHLNQIAGVAVALAEAMTPAFKKYAKQVKKNATVLANELSKLGWRVISGGTDSHLVLIDTWMNGKKNDSADGHGAGGISGSEASDRLERAGIIVNKNTIPGETRSAFDPSGIRIGSAAETTRGKKEADFKKIAHMMHSILTGKTPAKNTPKKKILKKK